MAKYNKSKLMDPEFECGQLVGFSDGLLLMHRILTDAVKVTAPMSPGISAFLRAFADGMGRDLPDMVRAYHKEKGLSVSLDISEGRKWN